MKIQLKIWIWMYNDRIYKAICNEDEGTLSLFDENDTLLIKRTGLSLMQMRLIEATLITSGAKRIDDHKEPFTYL
ncbi:MAG: hypothetical protein V1726_06130 [Methanobacteriota archaeon]